MAFGKKTLLVIKKTSAHRPYAQAELRGDKRKNDGKQYTGAVGGVVFPIVNGREGGEGDAAREYVAAVER